MAMEVEIVVGIVAAIALLVIIYYFLKGRTVKSKPIETKLEPKPEIGMPAKPIEKTPLEQAPTPPPTPPPVIVPEPKPAKTMEPMFVEQAPIETLSVPEAPPKLEEQAAPSPQPETPSVKEEETKTAPKKKTIRRRTRKVKEEQPTQTQ